MRILGIDPGKSGGWAIIEDGDLRGFGAMPVVNVPKGKKVTKALSPELLSITLRHEFPIDKAYIELVGSMPKQGVASSFDFGRSYGIAIGIVAAQSIPMEFIRPQMWRKVVGIKATALSVKEGSQQRAIQMWPDRAAVFEKKKNEGIWEAALIARAGYLVETNNA